MPWQKRNMFSSAVDMQRGGSVPWPSYEGGGAIGATPKERKRMFTIWDKMSQGQKEKVMDGKRYQMGGAVMPTQLFEEGDQDINMALNNMASMTNPSLEQIGETEMVEGEMMEDQGPASFEDALGMLKQEFYDQIGSFVTKTKDMAQIEKYLKGISVAYSNELDKLKREFDITDVHPDEELLTPDFVAEIQNMVTAPEMQLGGLVKTEDDLKEYGIPFPWEAWVLMSEEEKDNAMKMTLAARAGGTAGDAGVDNTAMMQRVNEIIEERMKLAKRSAEMPLTTQGGFGGFVEQMNAYRANQAAAQDKVLEDELDMLQYGNRYGTRGLGDISIPADTMNKMIAGDDMDKNDQAMLKLAQGQAKSVDDENPLLGVVYFRKFSPDGFLRVFPHYSGTKTIGGKEYTIDEYITYMIEEAKATGADEATKDEIASIALGSWLTAIAGEVDPLGIRG